MRVIKIISGRQKIITFAKLFATLLLLQACTAQPDILPLASQYPEDFINQPTSNARLELTKEVALTSTRVVAPEPTKSEIKTSPTTTEGSGIQLTIDRSSYRPDEIVNISLINNTDDPIWYEGGTQFWYLERQSANSEWVETPISSPSINPVTNKLECILNLSEPSPPIELLSGKSVLNELILGELCEWPFSSIGYPETEPALLAAGVYRVSARYGLNQQGQTIQEVNSQPFSYEH